MSNNNEHTEFLEVLGTNIEKSSRATYEGQPSFDLCITEVIDSCQWSILGDDSYTSAKSTIKTLPSNAYSVKLDNRDNLIFYKIKLTTDELIRFSDDVSNRIIESIKTFWASKDDFKKAGQIFKRGLLLWGPPGSGKSVTINLLVKDIIARNGVVFYCDHPYLLSRAIESFRKVEKDRSILVVLEDVDEIIEKHGESSILAILDGHLQVDNIVNIATTNYPERLDARLINRPSRFDEVIKVPMPNKTQRYEYFKFKIADLTEDELTKWANDTEGFSVAHMRELLVSVICLKSNYLSVLNRIKSMNKKIVSGTESSGSFGFAKS